MLVSVLASALFWATVDRVPVVWGDEEYFASTAYSLSQGRDAVATVISTAAGQPRVTSFYGPIFPYLGSLAFRIGGLSATTFRSISIAAALAAAFGAALFVRAAGAAREWAFVAFALMVLSPELGGAATNGRMDALAVAFEIAGLAAFARAARHEPLTSGLVAGGLWALATLTTPRTLPFVAGLVGACVVVPFWRTDAASRLSRAIVGAAVALGLPVIVWTITVHGSPFAWLKLLTRATVGDAVDASGLLGGRHAWGMSFRTIATPAASILAILLTAVWLGPRRIQQTFGKPTIFGAVAALFSVAIGAFITNRLFETGVYYSPQLLAVAIAVSGVAWAHLARRRAAMAAAWMVIAAVFLAIRTVKYLDAASSWAGRDPRPITEFFETNVSAGSVVYSRVPGFFYAVEARGASYRSYPRLFPESWVDRVDPSAAVAVDPPMSDTRYLLWPTDRVRFPLPLQLACAEERGGTTLQLPARQPLALPGSSVLARLVRTSLYEPVTLYRLSSGCGPDLRQDMTY